MKATVTYLWSIRIGLGNLYFDLYRKVDKYYIIVLYYNTVLW
jgi:hypothetical protein